MRKNRNWNKRDTLTTLGIWSEKRMQLLISVTVASSRVVNFSQLNLCKVTAKVCSGLSEYQNVMCMDNFIPIWLCQFILDDNVIAIRSIV